VGRAISPLREHGSDRAPKDVIPSTKRFAQGHVRTVSCGADLRRQSCRGRDRPAGLWTKLFWHRAGFGRFGLEPIRPGGPPAEAKRGAEPTSVPGYFGARRVEYFKRRFCISVTARPR